MRNGAFYFVFLALLVLVQPFVAHAANWPALPAACTPDRAVKWDDSKSATLQGACHCPPASMCPTTYAEYSNTSKSRMPFSLVSRCCPEIKPEACPAGSALAGQAMPADRNCNPTCPAGSALAGQPVPANGNCNPAVACAAKYYPTLNQAKVSNSANGYTYADGRRFEFDARFVDGNGDPNQDYAAMAQRYGFAIAEGALDMWVNLDNNVYNNYLALSDRANNTSSRLSAMMTGGGADKLVWFGISLAAESKLANNLASQAVLSEWGSRDVMQIGDYSQLASPVCTKKGGVTVCNGFNNQQFPIPATMGSELKDFIAQCQGVKGEYIELERVNTSGTQCAYFQCRYVYESTQESCLAGDVKISLADGTSKAVKDLKLGDVVKGSGGDHKIVAANTYQSALRVLYGINGGAALLTGDHPLHTKDGWKVINVDAAKLHAGKNGFAKTELKVGDVLITDKGEVVVKSIDRHAKVDPIATYNIKVEGNAGFYANGIEVKGFDKMEMKYE